MTPSPRCIRHPPDRGIPRIFPNDSSDRLYLMASADNRSIAADVTADVARFEIPSVSAIDARLSMDVGDPIRNLHGAWTFAESDAGC